MADHKLEFGATLETAASTSMSNPGAMTSEAGGARVVVLKLGAIMKLKVFADPCSLAMTSASMILQGFARDLVLSWEWHPHQLLLPRQQASQGLASLGFRVWSRV